MPPVILIYYCVLILLASVAGGMAPEWVRLTHRLMECAVSFVAGVMMGVALLHLLPHALSVAGDPRSPQGYLPVLQWVLFGWLSMFFLERFICFHHHDAPSDPASRDHSACDGDHAHSHEQSMQVHDLTWGGATLGLVLHSIMAGVALAASVGHEADISMLPGLGTFLVIVLHKPFDALTITMLMKQGGWSAAARSAVNAAFSLAIPLGVALFYLGVMKSEEPNSAYVGYALAFSAGMFLCISMSDLLPELQFHHHDRIKLSAALLAGLAVAYIACQFESHTHAPSVDAAAESVSWRQPAR